MRFRPAMSTSFQHRVIAIRRDNTVIAEEVHPGATLASLHLRSGDEIFVGNRNWLMRNQSFVVSILLAIPSVIYTISRID